MVKVKLTFNDGTISNYIQEIPEDTLIEQMKRPQNKRLYKCGIEFSAVEKAEVIAE